MKKASIVIIALIITSVPLQTSWAQLIGCPASHEKAEQDLKEYLSSEKNIDDLQLKHGLAVDDSSYNTIRALQDEKDSEVCSQLSKKAPWLENFEQYSFYKTENYYFIVMYSISDGTYKRELLDIFNKEYERLISVIDI